MTLCAFQISPGVHDDGVMMTQLDPEEENDDDDDDYGGDVGNDGIGVGADVNVGVVGERGTKKDDEYKDNEEHP